MPSALQSKEESEAEFRIQKTVPKNVQIWQTETHKRKPATNKKNSEVQVETQPNHISGKQDKRKILRTTREK